MIFRLGSGGSVALVFIAAGIAALGACTSALGKFKVAGSGGSGATSGATAGTGGKASTATGSGGTVTEATAAPSVNASSSTGSGPPKRVFVTSASYPGNLGGAMGAHGICQKAANAANLGGQWVAWIVDSGKSVVCTGGPWVLVDGKTDVGACSDLFAGKLMHPIDMAENQLGPMGNTAVWTGLGLQGMPSGPDCVSWTALSAQGAVGSFKQADMGWTNYSVQPCDAPAHVYCFEN